MKKQKVTDMEFNKDIVDKWNNTDTKFGTYTGEVIDGVPNGKGKWNLDILKEIYEGKWVDGKLNGKGFYDSGQTSFPYPTHYTYEGEFINDLFEGYGVQTGDPSRYEKKIWSYKGEWKQGVREGYGVYTDDRGRIYKGTWINGYLTGKGRCENPEYGYWYEGDFVNGKKEGYGEEHSEYSIKRYPGKYVHGYKGEWKNDVSHGKGVYYDEEGEWKGDWENGAMRGNGVWTSKNGWIYSGTWGIERNKGVGKITFPNGDVYEGEVKTEFSIEGLIPHGNGTFTYQDGSVYSGQFEMGRKYEKVLAEREQKRKEAEKKRKEQARLDEIKCKEEERIAEQQREERRKNRKPLTPDQIALRDRLEKKCKPLFGGETDRNKRFEILKHAHFVSHNSGYSDSMAWRLASGREDSETKFWDTACTLKYTIEALCDLYEQELD